MKCDCVLCKLENPKIRVNAVIIKDQKLLVAKKDFKDDSSYGKWDIISGFLQKDETPEKALRKEVKEKLGVECRLNYLGTFTGSSSYHGYSFPIICISYLTEVDGEILLNKKKGYNVKWLPLKKIEAISYVSNRQILKFIKKEFIYDLDQIKSLIFELDSNAISSEESLYKALLNGYISKIEIDGKLVGMGWIFPRQTLLRRQAVIEDLIVANTVRGEGHGEHILLDLINWAKKEGVEVIELTTNPKRIAANNLYKKVGFRLHETNHYLLNLK